MESLAAELKCPMQFVGFQTNIPEWLTAADIVLVPSHAEPLGNATLEAMAHGRPVIGGDVGGIPEMIIHNETGLLVPPKTPAALADALSQLLGNAAIRERMGIAARHECEARFSIEAHVRAVVAEYRIVLAISAANAID